jgi:UDP-glucose 4-epimerase
VAGDGVLTLSQALRRARRPWVALPAALVAACGRAQSPGGLADFSGEMMNYLAYGRGLDTEAMRRELGFAPRYTTAEAFAAFVDAGREVAGA